MSYARPRPNSVTINFDPVAWEKLTSLAMLRKDSREKIVYLATLNELARADEAIAEALTEDERKEDARRLKAFAAPS